MSMHCSTATPTTSMRTSQRARSASIVGAASVEVELRDHSVVVTATRYLPADVSVSAVVAGAEETLVKHRRGCTMMSDLPTSISAAHPCLPMGVPAETLRALRLLPWP
jgi:hypothetical protein